MLQLLQKINKLIWNAVVLVDHQTQRFRKLKQPAMLYKFQYTKLTVFYSSLFTQNSWYKEGSIGGPLQATLSKGGSKDMRTTSTLTITPRKEDDDARYKCVVHNRAMLEEQSLETSVTLNVNCKYF